MSIRKSFILQELRTKDEVDDGDQEQAHDQKSSKCSEKVTAVLHDEDRHGIACPDGSLEEIRRWLDTHCESEQARVDWTLEYQPIREDGQLNDVRIDTAILDRIRRGGGPREPTFEDLLAPLRRNEAGESCQASAPRLVEGTYAGMEKVIRDWNRQVTTSDNDPGILDALKDAMHCRIRFIEKVLTPKDRVSDDAHNNTCRKLLYSIHAYRPETAEFQTEDTSKLLIIILAHIGLAVPDVDNDTKKLMFYTLIKEREYEAKVANDLSFRRFERSIDEARKQGLVEDLVKHERKFRKWKAELLERDAMVIIKRIKFARGEIERKQIADIRHMKILEAAQKFALFNATSAPDQEDYMLRSALVFDAETACLLADAKLQAAAAGLSDYCDSASEGIEAMKDTQNARVLTRALKFTGREKKYATTAERNRAVQQRMSNPGTMAMMSDAIGGMADVKNKAAEVLEQVSSIENQLEEMLDAARVSYQAYGDMARLVALEEVAVESDYQREVREWGERKERQRGR